MNTARPTRARVTWILNGQEFPPDHLTTFLDKTGAVWGRAAAEAGFDFRFLMSSDVDVSIDSDGPALHHGDEVLLSSRELYMVDDISAEPGALAHLDAISRVIHTSDSLLLNNCMGAPEWLKRDKLAELSLAASIGLPVPRTVAVPPAPHSRRAMASVRRVIGDGPYIVKMRESGTGFGVLEVKGPEQLESALDIIRLTPKGFIVQELVPHLRDVRLAFVQNELVATLVRTPGAESTVANLARGGEASSAKEIDGLVDMAQTALAVLGAEYLCVDFLVGEQGAVFGEWATVMADFSSFVEPDRSRLAAAFFAWAGQRLSSG